MIDFSRSTFFLVSNYHTYGIQHALYNYLRKHGAKRIIFLNHPLHGVVKRYQTTISLYNGKEKTIRIKRRNLPEAVNYVLDLFVTIQAGFSQEKTDIFIGFNSMNTLAGILLRFFGKTSFIITYTHSYKQVRYRNPFLNYLYKLVDAFAVAQSNSVWGLSEALTAVRKQQGVPSYKIVHAPDGVDTELIKPLRYIPKKRYRLVFVGLINEMNGLELVIDAMPQLLSHFEQLSLDVIGEGDRLDRIKTKVRRYNIGNRVNFFGIESIDQLAKHLPQCGIGLAPYKPDVDSTLQTTDPMKTKLYMAAGLPIISTDTYKTAHEIRDQKLGYLIDYSVEDFIAAVKKLLDETLYKRYREHCVRYVKRYDWNVIFSDAFARTRFLKGVRA